MVRAGSAQHLQNLGSVAKFRRCATVAELDEILIGNRLSPSGCGHLGSEEKIRVKLGNLNCSLL